MAMKQQAYSLAAATKSLQLALGVQRAVRGPSFNETKYLAMRKIEALANQALCEASGNLESAKHWKLCHAAICLYINS